MHTTADIPEIEPTEVVAGDTLKWNKTIDHYSAAAGWSLAYYLTGEAKQTLTATQNGSTAGFSISITAAVTALWPPGEYKLDGFASKAGERYKVYEGDFEVLPNVAVQIGHHETRSKARQILDALYCLAQQRATRPEIGYSIQAAGRSFNFKSDQDIIDAITYWEGVVAREKGNAKIVKMKFQHAT